MAAGQQRKHMNARVGFDPSALSVKAVRGLSSTSSIFAVTKKPSSNNGIDQLQGDCTSMQHLMLVVQMPKSVHASEMDQRCFLIRSCGKSMLSINGIHNHAHALHLKFSGKGATAASFHAVQQLSLQIPPRPARRPSVSPPPCLSWHAAAAWWQCPCQWH